MHLKTKSNFIYYSLLPNCEKKKISPSIIYPCCINFYRPQPSFRFVSKPDLQLPRAQSTATSISPIQNIDELTKWAVEVEFEVRDYELDQFGVVKNAVYAQYCEHARLQVLVTNGCISADFIAGSGAAIALAEFKINFIAPLRRGDKFLVKIRISGSSMIRLFVDHYIVKLPSQEPILKARATVVWLNENHRPIRIPSDVVSNAINS